MWQVLDVLHMTAPGPLECTCWRQFMVQWDCKNLASAWCVAHDFHTIAPGPLERTCWRQFTVQWGDCKKSCKCSMCCTYFAHDNARATWTYVLETVHSAVRLQKSPVAPFNVIITIIIIVIIITQSYMIHSWINNWSSSGYCTMCEVCVGTGWPNVHKLWLGEIASVICNFYLSFVASTTAHADLSQRYTLHVAETLIF